MLMVLVNWLYMAVTVFLAGYALLSLFTRLFQYKIQYKVSYFLAGLLGVTVYAQFYSLFAGLKHGANLLLICICFLIVVLERKKLGRQLKDSYRRYRENRKQSWLCLSFSLALILLFAYGTSRGYMHFDTGLYHAQSIRWIEEYGVVPGLANLQSRFAYNSAAFSLTALYGLPKVFGQSLHTTAGFFALLSAFIAAGLKDAFTGRKLKLSHFVRLGLIFYLGVIFGEMVSPASDYYAQLLVFDILILWLDQDERQKEANRICIEPYCLLCILLVYAVTVKFSVGLLLLLVIKPAVYLIRTKKVKEIFTCLVSGILTALPFFIRNVIISGWMVYPATALDFFNVDWKFPKDQARLDALEIGAYGKGFHDVAMWDTPFKEWVPFWFGQLKPLEKVFAVATLLAVAVFLLWLIAGFLRKSKPNADFILVTAVFSAAAAFWFLKAPLIRYGYAYIITVPLLVYGYLYIRLADRIKKYSCPLCRVFQAAAVLFLLSRIPGLYEDISTTVRQPYYVAQRDYDVCEATTKELGGITFYIPAKQGQIGYDKFPSSLFAYPVELRGTDLSDGFRQIKEQ